MMRCRNQRGIAGKILVIICVLLMLIAFTCYFAAQWYVDVFGQMGFDSVLYTVLSGVGNAGSDMLTDFCATVLPKVIGYSVFVGVLLFFYSNRKIVFTFFKKWKVRVYPLHLGLASLICVCVSVALMYSAAVHVELLEYIQNLKSLSTVFEDEYRDPEDVEIVFPENKRNLIYVFMESMETTYLPFESGGASENNLIPELAALAQEHISFSHQENMGGLYLPQGTGWTIAAMVSQTSGVPLKTPPGVGSNDYGQDGNFLSGLNNITSVLRDEGYYQTLMVGSDATFGGRAQYYQSHNVDRIYDYYTAIDDGIIPEDYYVWWGFEDKYLFEYAKQELVKIAEKDQPFAFTMLTVDTHHVAGYVCEYCENTYEEQYENVISCASRQVAEFVKWIQQQDFYENTTVVLVGDHRSMDAGYFERNVPGDYQRTVYNCFLNSAVTTENIKNRGCCVFDMFPSTLAAMGCTIEGERLGLGTNLFSNVPTLVEEMGIHVLNEQLDMTSAYYNRNFYQKH